MFPGLHSKLIQFFVWNIMQRDVIHMQVYHKSFRADGFNSFPIASFDITR
jgi:hypothetical protein